MRSEQFIVYAWMGKITEVREVFTVYNGQRLQSGWHFVVDLSVKNVPCMIGCGKLGRHLTRQNRPIFINNDGDYVEPPSVILDYASKIEDVRIKERQYIEKHGRILKDPNGKLANLNLGHGKPWDQIETELSKAKRKGKHNKNKTGNAGRPRRMIVICDKNKNVIDRGFIAELDKRYKTRFSGVLRKRNGRSQAWVHKLGMHVFACYEEEFDDFRPKPAQNRCVPSSFVNRTAASPN